MVTPKIRLGISILGLWFDSIWNALLQAYNLTLYVMLFTSVCAWSPLYLQIWASKIKIECCRQFSSTFINSRTHISISIPWASVRTKQDFTYVKTHKHTLPCLKSTSKLLGIMSLWFVVLFIQLSFVFCVVFWSREYFW